MIKLTSGERLERVVCWTGLNTSSFATHIGLSSPQSLYQIKAGKHQISRAIAERICAHYPEIDFGWLFAGEGEMLRPQNSPIPYYAADCTEIALGKIPATPTSYMSVEGCGDCSFVAPYNSRSMEPEIRQGSLLFCKSVEPDELTSGEFCLLATGRVAWVRRVAEVTPEEIVLVGASSEIATQRVRVEQVERLYVVRALLEWKNV